MLVKHHALGGCGRRHVRSQGQGCEVVNVNVIWKCWTQEICIQTKLKLRGQTYRSSELWTCKCGWKDNRARFLFFFSKKNMNVCLLTTGISNWTLMCCIYFCWDEPHLWFSEAIYLQKRHIGILLLLLKCTATSESIVFLRSQGGNYINFSPNSTCLLFLLCSVLNFCQQLLPTNV